MKFFSTIPCFATDAKAYQDMKGVTPLSWRSTGELPSKTNHRVPKTILEMVGGSMVSGWMTHTFARLGAAALNHRRVDSVPASFPGRFLPRAGEHPPVDRGSLQVEWARHALEMEQPTQAAETATRRLNGDGLQVLCFPEATQRSLWKERQLRHDVRELVHARDAQPALDWVDALWSPRQHLPPLRKDLVVFARDLIKSFHGSEHDPLALLLEAHDVVRRLEAHLALGIERVGIGVHNGTWCEIGLIELVSVKATELVQTGRAIQELRTLYTSGFAPIVINEFSCNADGSHRQVATWLWNALCDSKNRRRSDLGAAVGHFIAVHRDEMGPLLAHEVGRVFQEAWADDELRLFIEHALCEARPDRTIERLPVVLVPEWSSATIVKGPYDDEGRSVRVCQSVYGLLARDRRVVLPARGPYHRTDACLLPWFRVVPD